MNRYAAPKDPGLNERLLKSVQAGELSAIRDLLAKGADPNVTVNAFFPPKPPDRPGVLVFNEEKYTTADPGPSRRGVTTLLILSVPRIEIMGALLDGGARIDARNTSGATALLAAVERACVFAGDQTLGAIKLLVERGSDLAVRDAKGRAVSDLAACRMSPLKGDRFLVPLIAEALKRK